ncbi:glycosyltransferase [Phormidesmis priestleyi]
MRKLWNSLDDWVQSIQSRDTRRQALRTAPNKTFKLESLDRSSIPRSTVSPLDQLSKPGHVSVILPVYNEEACIGRTLHVILGYLQTHPNYTFIFVDDGSSDRTKLIISSGIHSAKTRQIRLLSYSPRAGKGYAISRGVDYAQSDYVCFLDGDLAYSLDHLDRLVEKLEYAEVAIGCRSLVSHNKDLRWSRKIAGKVYNFLSRKVLNLQYRDMQADLKGFQKHAAKTSFSRQELTGFSFDAELLYLARKLGYTIVEIPAKVSDKHQAKPSKVNLVQDSIRMLIDLLRIRFNDVIGRYR